MTIEERFWQRVDQSAGPDGCWVWTGARLAAGYGRSPLGRRGKGPLAHRRSWELANGPIPQGMHVLHHCDNPPCVNPAHLFLGTDADNVRDAQAKGRLSPLPHPSGDEHYHTKISDADVLALVVERASGVTVKDLAEKYGITIWHVYLLLAGKRKVVAAMVPSGSERGA